jgi:hypothetical protein
VSFVSFASSPYMNCHRKHAYDSLTRVTKYNRHNSRNSRLSVGV